MNQAVQSKDRGLWRSSWLRRSLAAGALSAAALAPASRAAEFTPPRPAEAENMALVGYDTLQGRTSYQIVPHLQGGRWLLYVGHMDGSEMNPMTHKVEENGVSILDVTDPAKPVYLHHIPTEPTPWYKGNSSQSGTYHIQVCDGSVLPHGQAGKTYLLRTVGSVAYELMDVTDPLKPKHIVDVLHSGPTGDPNATESTHKGFWDCKSGVAFLTSSVEGWKVHLVLRAFDLSDPEHPAHIRDFGLVGSQPGGEGVKEGASGTHEAQVLGDRLYVAYSPFSNGVVQILDLNKFLKGDPASPDPMAPTPANLLYPQIGRLNLPSYWGAHTAKPILGMTIPDYANDKKGAKRDIMMLVSEGVNVRCGVPRHISFFLDITEPQHPFPISSFQVPASSGDYCNRTVTFGPHAPQALSSPMYDKKIILLAYMSAGVRAIDIRNPFSPVEIAHYIPAATAATYYKEWKGPYAGQTFESVPKTNQVEVDPRGNIFIVDRAHTGLHILKLTGPAAEIAAAPAP